MTGRYAFSERKLPGKLSWTAEARIPVRYRLGYAKAMIRWRKADMDLIASTTHHADLVQDAEKLVYASSRSSGCASRQLDGDYFIKHQPATWRCS